MYEPSSRTGTRKCYVNVVYITKTYLYNFDPLKPHFHVVKLGFTGVYIIFHISAQNIDYGYPLELPRRGGSNYPQSMFWAEIWKISFFFLSENIHFLVIKFLVYLNRLLFVMTWKYRVTGLHTSGYSKEGIEQSDRKVLVHASAIRFLFFFFFFVWRYLKLSFTLLIHSTVANDSAR